MHTLLDYIHHLYPVTKLIWPHLCFRHIQEFRENERETENVNENETETERERGIEIAGKGRPTPSLGRGRRLFYTVSLFFLPESIGTAIILLSYSMRMFH